jgi:integrase
VIGSIAARCGTWWQARTRPTVEATRPIGIPAEVAVALTQHKREQDKERANAGDLWRDEGWVFTNHVGGPVHPTVDYEAWKALLRAASVP